MQIIPVVDLLGGLAVRAVRGERATYRPVASVLCPDSDPCAVAATLLEYCDSRLLYVADLDAIVQGAGRPATIARLIDALPGVEIWLDAGFGDADTWRALAATIGPSSAALRPVFASESLRSAAAAREALADPQALLSLDRRRAELPDRAGCWADPSLWPARVIAMTLDRVGTLAGPDLGTLAELRERKPGVALVGAGGIGGPADLELARGSGAAAWLVASCLHDLRIGPQRRV